MDVECFSVVVDYEAKAYLLFGCVMLYLLLVVWVVHASAKVAYFCHNIPKKKDEEKKEKVGLKKKANLCGGKPRPKTDHNSDPCAWFGNFHFL